MRIYAWGLGLLMVSAIGCAPTPESTFADMQKAACAADVAGFFARVDKTKVGENIGKNAMGQATATAPKAGLAAAGAKLGGQLAKAALPGIIQGAFTQWEDDIKKGEEGALCHMTFESVSAGTDSATVFWKTRSGQAKTFELQRFGDRWMVVAMN